MYSLGVRRVIGLLLFAALASAKDAKKSYWVGKKFTFPRAPKEDWVNLRNAPSTRDVKGKLLFVNFGFLS